MKRTILFCAAGLTCLPLARGQITFDESGLSESLPYPQWTTPTPACYDLTTETHYDIKMGSCDGDKKCSGDEERYNGCEAYNSFSYYRTSGGVEILYPPFADRAIKFIKQRDDYDFCDYVRSDTKSWYASELHPKSGNVDYGDDFIGLNHLRYSSYLFDEKGANKTGITSSCPFKTQGGWANEILCAAAKLVRFNRLPIISSNMGTSNHVKDNVIKQVYYCDADKSIDYTLSSTVGSGSVRTYCFAPQRGSLSIGTFSTDDRNMEGAYNSVFAYYAAYDKQWGTAAVSHSYKFRVQDWISPSYRDNVNVLDLRRMSVDAVIEKMYPDMVVKKLNNGLEVYIVVLAGEEVEYKKGRDDQLEGKVQFYGKPRLLRTHVYPVKPKWKKTMFGSNFCINDGPIDLSTCVDMGTQTFNGKFVVVEGDAAILDNNILDLSNMAVNGNLTGKQFIKIRCYPYWSDANGEDEGRSPYMELSGYVYPKPVLTVINELEKVCSYETEFIPDHYSADRPGTGVYSGSFFSATGSRLNAAKAVEAEHTSVSVTYTYTTTTAEGGCAVDASYTQVISVAPDLSDFTMPKSTFCFDEEIKLRECTSVTGGTFSGFGVKVNGDGDTIFSSAFAGIGNGDIYFRKANNGCTAEKKVTVSVRDLQESAVEFSKPPAMCANGEPIYLPDYLSDSWASNGSFAGKGVESPRFYPDKAGAEYPKITYSYGLTGCKVALTQEVQVKTPAALTLSSIPAVCSDDEIDLSKYLNIKGGTFEGTAINGNIFAPVTAGIGSHPISYTVTDAKGCTLSRDFNVVVNDLLPDDVSFEGIPEQCSGDAGYLDLRFYVKGHTDGTFSGKGVDNYRFYPSRASIGFNMLTYSYGNGGCRRTIQTEVYVTATPSVTFEKFDRVCDNDPIKLMDYVSPKGGTFSGYGVVDNVFYPTQAGLGSHEVTYIDSVGSCPISGKALINVSGLSDNDAAFRTLPEVCATDEGYLDLRGYVVNAPDNGTFTGAGIEGFRYYPAKAKLGYNTITYSFATGNCPKTIRSEVFVRSVPTVSFRSAGTVCTRTVLDLAGYVTRTGGTFSGAGVLGNLFYAEQAGVGKHEITYTVSINGCPSYARMSIDVADLQEESVSFYGIPPVCTSDSSWYDLRTYVHGHSGGTFSGKGVDGYRFYPSQSAAGYVSIGYEYGSGSCKRTIYMEALVHGKPEVSLAALPTLCEATAEVNLRAYASPSGGAFSGVGVSNGAFSAAAAGVGRHSVSYRYTDGYGCTNSAARTIDVSDSYNVTVTFGGLLTLCATDEGYYDLADYVQGHTGGTFTGNGVESGRFYPARAKTGFNTLTYTYGSGACQRALKADVSITAVPATKPIAVAKVCSNEAIRLMDHVNNKGGTFTGNGVQDNLFYPAAAGFGEHSLRYEALIDKCYSRADLAVEVLSVAAPPAFGSLPTLCKSDSGYIDLREYILSYQEGTFSGQGVESYRYYPLRAKDGFNTITYTYGSGSCQRSLKAELYVTPKPELTLAPFTRICTADAIPLPLHANISGGAWSGAGVFGDSFIAEQAGTGTHQLTYTVTQGLCRVTGAVSVEVASLLPKQVVFDSIPDMCAQDLGYIDLQDYVKGHSGGTFTGAGVESGRFYPAKAKVGFNTLTYRYGSGSCAYAVTAEAKILPVAATIATAVPKVCTNSPVALMAYVNNKGGSFSGAGVARDTFFPESAGIGTHEATYEAQMGGCTSRATLTIEVLSVAEPPAFGSLPTLCKSDSGYIDLREYILSYQEGTFSGQGVESYRYYPLRAKDGFNTITYTYGSGSCQRSLKAELYVTPKPELTLAPFTRICTADAIPLPLHANISGGAWSGAGVFGDSFIAEQAGTGTHQLTYTVTQGLCRVTGAVSVEVASLLPKQVTFDSIPDMCAQDLGYIDLQDYVQGHSGGTFTGAGVESGRFYPAKAKVGFNTLTYRYGSGSCAYAVTAEAKILPVAATIATAVPKVCTNSPVALMAYVNNKGGSFSGAGVARDTFFPESAGIGTHEATYEAQMGGCTSRATLTIEVLSVAEPPAFDQLPTLCKSDSGYIDLREYILSYQEGTFSGQGVESYRYYPLRAKDGFNTITYAYGSGSCQRSLKAELYVTPKPELTLAPFTRICTADTVPLPLHANISGGAWSGAGVFGDSFIAEQAGTGTHQLTYTVTQGLCRVTGAVSVEVASLLPKQVVFDSIPDMCAQDLGYIDLQDYVKGHSGGTFTGAGVESGRFYPAKAKVGFNTLTYSYGSGSCAATIRAEVEVTNSSATKVSIAPLPKFCKADTLNLNGYVNAKGGVFTGAGVLHDTLFLSDMAGVGTHELAYQVRLNGCNSYTTAAATVLSLNRTDIRFKSPLPDFCATQTDAVDLFELVENSSDGAFSGKGVEQSRYFYPSKAGAEVSAITYTYGVGTCQQKITADVKVYNAPNKGVIEIDDMVALCGGSIDLGAMVEPKGGTFTGAYIYDGVFQGDSAPLGETEVAYTVANKGCRLSKSILVKNEPAQTFDFTASVNAVTEGGRVQLTPERTNMREYTWYFGDGGYSKETSPWHYYYHADATFDVKLEVKNSLGCTLSALKKGFISVGSDVQGRYVQVAGLRHYAGKPTVSAGELEAVSAATGCEALEIIAFPNPVTNNTLSIGHVECVSQVEIYDLSMSRLMVVEAPEAAISTASLRPGMYLVALKLVDGGLKVSKIVVK